MAKQADVFKLLNIELEGDQHIGKGHMKEPDLSFATETDEEDFVQMDQIVALQALTSELKFNGIMPSILNLMGICSGNRKRLIGRASYEENCVPTSYKITLEGVLTELPGVEIQAGKRVTDRAFKFGSINYYKLEIGGKTIHEIDRDNHIIIVNGVDLMAQHRINAGV